MECSELCARLDATLDTAAYADADASANGLQVGPADADVATAALAVDAAKQPIDAAVEAGVDLLVTHHGLFWGGVERITGRLYSRVAPLVEHDIPLYVSHVPLDGHQELGNAAGLADVLDLDDRAPFGTYGEGYVGQRGRLPEPVAVGDLVATLELALDTGGEPVRCLDVGPDRVQDVAIVTGSGADWLDEAADLDADVLVTGEGKGHVYHDAREAGINVVLGGHYATETFGVRSLGTLLEEWGLETTFLDYPTGL